MATSIEDKDRIERLEELLEMIRASTGAVLSTTSNYIAANNISTIHSQTGTAGGNVALMAGLIKPKVTGVFYVDLSVSFSCDTTAKGCSISLVSDTSAAGALAAGAGGATIASAGIGGTGNVGGGFQVLTSDAAGTAANGIVYNAAPFTTAPIVQKVAKQTTLTGLLTASVAGTDGAGNQTFEAHGLMYDAIGTVYTKFPLANTVAFALMFTDTVTGAEVWTFESVDFRIQELAII